MVKLLCLLLLILNACAVAQAPTVVVVAESRTPAQEDECTVDTVGAGSVTSITYEDGDKDCTWFQGSARECTDCVIRR